ncbi:MAG TPA: uroporphyrinogen decarboxylase family protein [Spirochaetota bacterium]|nr:uroporphyrinogen decarboxylase family protein [Spirochaetota bacterium]
MAQTSLELIKAALAFKSPYRLPVKMEGLGISDVVNIPRLDDHKSINNKKWLDEWGCTWEKTDMENMGQVTGHPLQELADVSKMTIPDYNQSWRYETCEDVFRQAEKEEKYTSVGIFMILFERMHSLAGFEKILMGLMTDRKKMEELADKIVAAQISLVKNYQQRFGDRLHAFGMTEDWGTQKAAFISRELWDDFFFPRYQKIFDVMHSGGQDVWVHSCGKINEIAAGFIKSGVNALNLQQPRALGIKEMGERYRGRVTFESLADIQATLPRDDEAEIIKDAEELGKYWMLPEGGFVFSDYGEGEAIGASKPAKISMYNAFSKVSEKIYGNPLPELSEAAG